MIKKIKTITKKNILIWVIAATIFTLSLLIYHFIYENNTSYAKAVSRAAPTVVNIFSNMEHGSELSGSALLTVQEENNQHTEEQNETFGAGVIVTSNGFIVTSFHNIKDMDSIHVILRSGVRTPARLVNYDVDTDIAILKVNLTELPFIKWADSSKTKVGDIALSIGNPFGVGQTVTKGIISATHRNLDLNTYEHYLQTDAAINKGNSGGALVNTKGELIGIISAILSSDGGYEGLSFAVPSNQVKFVAESIINNSKVIRGWLGIELAAVNDNSGNPSYLVTDIAKNSSAEKAGIQQGDVIKKFNGKSIARLSIISDYISRQKVGDQFKLKILRDNKKITKKLIVTAKPQLTHFESLN